MRFTTFAAAAAIFTAATAMPAATAPASKPAPNTASITSVKPANFKSYPVGGLARGSHYKLKPRSEDDYEQEFGEAYTEDLEARDRKGHSTNIAKGHDHPLEARGPKPFEQCSKKSQFTWGDQDTGGKGIVVTNGAKSWQGFYVYDNSCDTIPLKHFWLGPMQTQFISLPNGFQGRVSRGNDAINLAGKPQLLGTWLELSFDPIQTNALWGDVSLIQGADGGMLMWALDGSGAWKGFTHDIMAKAPVGAWAVKPGGTWVLAPTEGPTADAITLDWELKTVGAENAYVSDRHGNPVIVSKNGRYGVWMSEGRI